MPASGWPSSVIRPETGATFDEEQPDPAAQRLIAINATALRRKEEAETVSGMQSVFGGDFAVADGGEKREDLHVNVHLDWPHRAIAVGKVEHAGMEAAPAVFALGDVVGNASAGIVIREERGTLGVRTR